MRLCQASDKDLQGFVSHEEFSPRTRRVRRFVSFPGCVCSPRFLPPRLRRMTRAKSKWTRKRRKIMFRWPPASARPVLSKTIADLSRIQYPVPNQPAGAEVTAHSRVAGTPGGDQAARLCPAGSSRHFRRGQCHGRDVSRDGSDRQRRVCAGRRPARSRWPCSRSGPIWSARLLCPTAGINGPLIYAGRGELRNFRGKPVEGSIVLLDFNCGTEWLNAARLGAKAIIFVEPTQTMRGEGESKFIGIPVAVPRFWISRADAAALQSAALTTPNFHSASGLRQSLAGGNVCQHRRHHQRHRADGGSERRHRIVLRFHVHRADPGAGGRVGGRHRLPAGTRPRLQGQPAQTHRDVCRLRRAFFRHSGRAHLYGYPCGRLASDFRRRLALSRSVSSSPCRTGPMSCCSAGWI